MRALLGLALAVVLLLTGCATTRHGGGQGGGESACGGARSLMLPVTIYGAGAAADLATTEQALARGAAEANPSMQGGAGQRAAIKAAQVAAVTAVDQAGCERLARPGRCRWLLRAGWLVVHGWVAAHNARVSRPQP